MPSHDRISTFCVAALMLATTVTGCNSALMGDKGGSAGGPNARVHDRQQAQVAQDQEAAVKPSEMAPSQAVQPIEPLEEISKMQVYEQIPDPRAAVEQVRADMNREMQDMIDKVDVIDGLTAEEKEKRREAIRREYTRRTEEVIERYESVSRPVVIELPLEEAIRSALQHSYFIQSHAYQLAIDAARVVEAEAQFDAIFYSRYVDDKQDRPTSSQLMSSKTVTRMFETGVRKMLPTGMNVRGAYSLQRTQTNLVFQTLNPAYFESFVVEFGQPLLRNFGLDVNRAQIEVNKIDRQISVETYRRQIRETIYNVEQAYWTLLSLRRRVAITARLLAELEMILNSLEKRKEADYDVYAVQLEMTKARIEQTQAEFIRLRNEVRNAEDALKALVNDPKFNLSKDVEIVPIDVPLIEAVMVDKMGEAAAALEHRAELNEARLAIEKAQIGVGVAKNQALPRLDLLFRYTVDGLGTNADKAFSQLVNHDFTEYYTAIEFEWPIGNRGPEAKLRQARLRQAQAIVAYRAQIENVIAETLKAVRDMQTSYEQIGPSLRSAQASVDQLRATQERMIKRDPPNLQVELDAHQALASARDQLLQVVVNYNLALTNLERRKGTLLEYYNIRMREGCDYKPMNTEMYGQP